MYITATKEHLSRELVIPVYSQAMQRKPWLLNWSPASGKRITLECWLGKIVE